MDPSVRSTPHRRRAPLAPSLTAAFALLAALGSPLAAAVGPTGARAVAASPAAEPRPFVAQLEQIIGVPGGLTADEVARRAEASSFDVAARQHEIAAAASDVDRALVAYLPRLALSASYARNSSVDQPEFGNLVAAPGAAAGPLPPDAQLVSGPVAFPDILDSSRFQAGVSIPLSDYLAVLPERRDSADRLERAARLRERATRLETARDGRLAYYAWIRSRLQEVVAEQSVDDARRHLADVGLAFEAGTASKADVLRVESQLADAELLLTRSRNLTAVTEDQLRNLMHDDPREAYAIGDALGEPERDSSTEAAPAELLAAARRRRLEVAVFDELAPSYRSQAAATRAGAVPRLAAFGDVLSANPNERVIPSQDRFDTTWNVGVALTWAPNDLADARAAAAGLDARAAQSEADKARFLDALRSEVVSAHQALADARASLATSARRLAAAEESYRVRRLLFQNGSATSVELTDAETDVTEARLAAIHARVDVRSAAVRLEHAVGADVGGAAALVE